MKNKKEFPNNAMREDAALQGIFRQPMRASGLRSSSLAHSNFTALSLNYRQKGPLRQFQRSPERHPVKGMDDKTATALVMSQRAFWPLDRSISTPSIALTTCLSLGESFHFGAQIIYPSALCNSTAGFAPKTSLKLVAKWFCADMATRLARTLCKW